MVGARGYAGQELARLLLTHPRLAGAPPLFFGREEDSLLRAHPGLRGLAPEAAFAVRPFAWEALAGVDTVFLATPHEQSREWVPEGLRRGFRIVDLSGAWRLTDPADRAVYGFADTPETDAVQAQAVYGLPELHAAAIAGARLVANPGCYATSVILALKPLLGLLDPAHGIIADAKSGVSGAGREPTPKTHFMHAANSLSAYGLWGHRHGGELREQLGLREITFTPHLLPIPRGILSTVYVRFASPTTDEQARACFTDFYKGRRLVRVFPGLPEINAVERTSFCDLGVSVAPDGLRAIVVSCLDNLLKGAAGQAVQNWNLMHGFDEGEGLL